jgi:hypothetical protein
MSYKKQTLALSLYFNAWRNTGKDKSPENILHKIAFGDFVCLKEF